MNKSGSISFVRTPNLPSGPVSDVIIGEKYADILGNSLKKLDISIIKVPDNPNLQPGLSGHADMSVLHCGGGDIVCAKEMPLFVKLLTNRGVNVISAQRGQAPDYPNDVGLNACIVGEYIIHNEKFTDPAASELLHGRYKPINAHQGYAKCSVCVVSENSIITSDTAIHNEAIHHKINSFLIQPGHFELTGYDTGFIGGCCGKISNDVIAFTGRLDGHPDKDKIQRYINEQGIDIVYLTDRPCFDVGSILPVCQYSAESAI